MFVNRIESAAALCFVLFSAVANAVALPPQEVPTQLVDPATTSGPDGSCSLCGIFPLLINPSDPSLASLALYYADDGDDAIADIEIEVLLFSEEIRTIFVDDVDLDDGQMHTFSVRAERDWTWEDAQKAWVTVHETSP